MLDVNCPEKISELIACINSLSASPYHTEYTAPGAIEMRQHTDPSGRTHSRGLADSTQAVAQIVSPSSHFEELKVCA